MSCGQEHGDNVDTDLAPVCSQSGLSRTVDASPAVCKAGKAAWAIKSKVAALLAVVVRQQGTSAYAAVLPQLLSNADTNTLQVWKGRGYWAQGRK